MTIPAMRYPNRIVCLAAETPEILDRLDVFERIVATSGFARQPDVMIASWCGKKADLAAIRARPGWASIPAVVRGHVYELPSAQILQTGQAC